MAPRLLRKFASAKQAPLILAKMARDYVDKLSIPDISNKYGIPLSTVRYSLIQSGVKLRTHTAAGCVAARKISLKLRGKAKPPFSDRHRKNISDSKRGKGSGVSFKKNSYIQITMGKDKGRGQHVVIMEAHLGRRLVHGEVVHHIDENKHNNSIENLRLMTRSSHTKLHRYYGRPK